MKNDVLVDLMSDQVSSAEANEKWEHWADNLCLEPKQ